MMSPTTQHQPDLPSPPELEAPLQGLIEYCHQNRIYVAPSVAPRKTPGRGIGMYAIRPIKSGQRLMSVPTPALVTTRSIPEEFFSDSSSGIGIGDDLTVHTKLAAYFAFGGNYLKKYAKWMATWPDWDDFTTGMPVFWNNEISSALIRKHRNTAQNESIDSHLNKRRKMSDREMSNGSDSTKNSKNTLAAQSRSSHQPFVRSPTLDGRWLSSDGSQIAAADRSLAHAMCQKITAQIVSLKPYFPQLSSSITDLVGSMPKSSSSDQVNNSALQRLLHAWCLINTRCFYYHPPAPLPGSHLPPPADPDECMALCPGMDLFNHSTDPQNCHVKFDRTGFSVTARRNYEIGDEVLLSYGSHNNDVLWIEYGFFLSDDGDKEESGNRGDEVSLDALLLPSLSEEEKDLLDQYGYLGAYSLRGNSSADGAGVCYRTVVLAYYKVLNPELFARVVSGVLDSDKLSADEKQAVNEQITSWMNDVLEAAEGNLSTLAGLEDKEEDLVKWLGTSVLDPVANEDTDTQRKRRIDLAHMRKDMCMRRWRQIQLMAKQAKEQYHS